MPRPEGTCRFRHTPTLPSSHTDPGEASDGRHLSNKTYCVRWPLSQTVTHLDLPLPRKTSAFDTYMATGDLLVGDVGQNDIEEVDRVVKGGNYGCNRKEGTLFFNFSGFSEAIAALGLSVGSGACGGLFPPTLAVLGMGQDASGELYALGNISGLPFGTQGVVLRIAPKRS